MVHKLPAARRPARLAATLALALVLALLLALPACQRAGYLPTARLAPTTSQPVGAVLPDDPAAAALIRPYHDQVTSQMSEVVGTAPLPIGKGPGESPLLNFVGDVQRAAAARALGEPIALGLITPGGLRAPLPAGPITLGAVFELMPFENELVVLDAPADVVQQLFALAAKSRTPLAGATYAVGSGDQPTDIRINGQPLDLTPGRRYTIATSDYLASGGDNLGLLRALPTRRTGLLLRTAIADHIRALTKAGRLVEARVEGRVRINQ